ncbi:MAG: hypothetical protein EOO65_01530 [Methanosarcinales archaeon]|nr:MAG: hypothetical protein EOO65_01530 [Methanosarcinales archaeon]
MAVQRTLSITVNGVDTATPAAHCTSCASTAGAGNQLGYLRIRGQYAAILRWQPRCSVGSWHETSCCRAGSDGRTHRAGSITSDVLVCAIKGLANG